jgi:hypothetical protein
MGAKLAQYYDLVKQRGGGAAQMRLAMKTAMALQKAETEPDSPELLDKFYNAAKEIVGADIPRL